MVLLLWCILASGILLLLLAPLLWFVYGPVVARRFVEMPWFPSGLSATTADDYPGGIFDAEEVAFAAADGVSLAGTYLPTTAAERKGVVIFCHEFRGSRWTALEFTGGLRNDGFDIFAFDFRNHGDSAVKAGYRPLPWATTWETVDVQAAIDYCCQRNAAFSGKVVLFGLSRGAATALCVAATEPRVRAAVLDSVVPTEEVQVYLIRRFMHLYLPRVLKPLSQLPDRPFRWLAFWANHIIRRSHGGAILGMTRAAQRVRKPLLLIHGCRDGFVPLATVCSLRRQMRIRPKVWVIPQARHNQTAREAGDDYHRRVVRFVGRHLETQPAPALVEPEPIRADAAPTPAVPTPAGRPAAIPVAS